MDSQSDFTDAVIVDNGRVVMRVTTDAPNGEMVIYGPQQEGAPVNPDGRSIAPVGKRGRVSRSSIYVGNAQLMKELPSGYCEYERRNDQVVNQ